MSYKLNLVQLLFYPIMAVFGVIGLAFWLRDLCVPEWLILVENPFLVQILSGIIVAFIIILLIFVLFCNVKTFRLLTKFVSEEELEKEFKRIKRGERDGRKLR